ncbi:MAG: MFS transporter [Gracilibacteraceae bacterium]|nr:MFS transporter [Gracilibacteraceae bacterium]
MDITAKTPYQNYLLVSLLMVLCAMTAGICLFKIPMILTDLAESYGIQLTDASWLMAIFTFTGIFCAVPAGLLGRRFHPKRMLTAGIFCVALGSLLGAFAPNFSVLILTRALEGVGFSFVAVCGTLTVKQAVEPANIGKALGIWAVWLCLGQIAAFAVTPSLYALGGARGLWLFTAALAAFMGVVVALALRVPGESAPAGEKSPPLSALLSNGNFWKLGLAYLIYNLFVTAVLTFGPACLTEGGVGTARAAILTSLPMLLPVASSPACGALMDRLGVKKPFLIITHLGTVVGAWMFFSFSGVLLYLGVVIMGVFCCNPTATLNVIPDILKNPEDYSGAIGLLMVFQNTGMFLGSLSMSYLLLPAGGVWAIGALLLLPVGLLAALLAWRVSPRAA